MFLWGLLMTAKFEGASVLREGGNRVLQTPVTLQTRGQSWYVLEPLTGRANSRQTQPYTHRLRYGAQPYLAVSEILKWNSTKKGTPKGLSGLQGVLVTNDSFVSGEMPCHRPVCNDNGISIFSIDPGIGLGNKNVAVVIQ